MAFKKFVKRAVRKVGKAVKKRYTNKKGGVKLSQLVRDVALVKRSLNVEKKHIQSAVTANIDIGQTNGITDTGQAFFDVSPAIVQGVGYSNMTGNSVKVVSCAIFGQVKQMSAAQHPMRIKICLCKSLGQPQTMTSIQSANKLFDVNPLTSVTDYNSSRNVNYFKDFKIIKTQYVYLMPDPTSGELIIKNFKFLMKMTLHMKWNQNTTTLTDGQLFIACFSDSGNSSTSVAATNTQLPVLKINSGATLQMYSKFYYVDN